MKPIAIAIHAMLGVAFATGCSTPGTPVPQVKPIETVRHGGDQADGYYQLGRFMQRQGRLPQAIDALSKAIAIDPRHAEARNELGTAFASAGDLGRAVSEFEAAVAIDPATARYWNNLGYARYLQGRHAEAVAAFEKAVALDSSSSRAWNNLGMALTSLGDGARAGKPTHAPAGFPWRHRLQYPDGLRVGPDQDSACGRPRGPVRASGIDSDRGSDQRRVGEARTQRVRAATQRRRRRRPTGKRCRG